MKPEARMTPEVAMQEMLVVVAKMETRRRTAQVMDTAARLFPYLAQDFTQDTIPLTVGSAIAPSDNRRIAAAVEAAWRIQELIEQRVTLRMETERREGEQGR